jgi:hypothetical protein
MIKTVDEIQTGFIKEKALREWIFHKNQQLKM